MWRLVAAFTALLIIHIGNNTNYNHDCEEEVVWPAFVEANMQDQVRWTMRDLGYCGYSFHGLRKNSTNHLAEMGLTPLEIGGLNGMSIETVQHYTHKVSVLSIAQRNQARLNAGQIRASLKSKVLKN